MTMMAGEYLDSGPLTDLTNGEEVSDGWTQESSFNQLYFFIVIKDLCLATA